LIPGGKGVAPRRRNSLKSPPKIPPLIAPPIATALSGLTPLLGLFPKIPATIFGVKATIEGVALDPSAFSITLEFCTE